MGGETSAFPLVFMKPEFSSPSAREHAALPNTVTARLKRASMDSLLEAPSITITGLLPNPLTLEIHGSQKVSSARADCRKALFDKWSIDPAEAAKVDAPAEAVRPFSWVTSSDYPKDALSRRQAGAVTTILEIGADTNVKGCRIAQSSGFSGLDAGTCAILLQRARFRSPALDGNQQPVRSWFIRTVFWSLPQ